LRLLVAVERNETVSFLRTIKLNTILAVALLIIAIVFLFYYISRKLANPYKRAIAMNKELEEQVALRTRELTERNEEILDSIGYAKLLQQSLLPLDRQMAECLSAHFVIWRPRDVVGGDFYWVKQVGERILLAVGDCTGHGVPGAFMTLLAVSALNRIVETIDLEDPAAILSSLNRSLKHTLHQEDANGLTDDGLDMGMCVLDSDRLIFAGAACSLYKTIGDEIQEYKGDRKSIGYRKTPIDFSYSNHVTSVENACFYLTTDGLFDQNGGEKGYSFGKKRFSELIANWRNHPLSAQKNGFLQALSEYMGNEPQRDDITVVGFRANNSALDIKDGGRLGD